MTFKEFLKINKKRIILIFLFVLIVLIAFFVTAYFSGKKVTDDVPIQWVSHTEMGGSNI